MPGPILTKGALIQCAHQGQAQPILVNFRVRVMGQNVITRVTPMTIAGCTLQPPPAGNGPCVTAQWLTAALRVRASGLPVLLADSQALCTPTGTPLAVRLVQQRVKAF
jgi:hypothetical protein